MGFLSRMTAQKRFAWRSRNIEAVNYADIAEMQYGNDLEENMKYISIAKETKRITKEGRYMLNGTTIYLPEMDYTDVKVYSPEAGASLVENHVSNTIRAVNNISIVVEDSFQAAGSFDNPFVMNFANAHKPGGGFEMGATAQEEALCRCSTLFASISSEKAKEMYRYNNLHISSVESDYMLLSKVCVFRNEKCELLRKPFMVGVISVPAPNRIGLGVFASEKEVEHAMLRRIRIMLLIAKDQGYKAVVLGAWGCGAFHNDVSKVAGYFKKVLIDEGYAGYFEHICFAIYGSGEGKNISAFRRCFGGL